MLNVISISTKYIHGRLTTAEAVVHFPLTKTM